MGYKTKSMINNNFSPTTKSVADYTYGSDVARGY
jgi:hypothetical protein